MNKIENLLKQLLHLHLLYNNELIITNSCYTPIGYLSPHIQRALME